MTSILLITWFIWLRSLFFLIVKSLRVPTNNSKSLLLPHMLYSTNAFATSVRVRLHYSPNYSLNKHFTCLISRRPIACEIAMRETHRCALMWVSLSSLWLFQLIVSRSLDIHFDVCLGLCEEQRMFNIPYLLFKFPHIRVHAIDFITLHLYDCAPVSPVEVRASSDSYPHRIRSVSPRSRYVAW